MCLAWLLPLLSRRFYMALSPKIVPRHHSWMLLICKHLTGLLHLLVYRSLSIFFFSLQSTCWACAIGLGERVGYRLCWLHTDGQISHASLSCFLQGAAGPEAESGSGSNLKFLTSLLCSCCTWLWVRRRWYYFLSSWAHHVQSSLCIYLLITEV